MSQREKHIRKVGILGLICLLGLVGIVYFYVNNRSVSGSAEFQVWAINENAVTNPLVGSVTVEGESAQNNFTCITTLSTATSPEVLIYAGISYIVKASWVLGSFAKTVTAPSFLTYNYLVVTISNSQITDISFETSTYALTP